MTESFSAIPYGRQDIRMPRTLGRLAAVQLLFWASFQGLSPTDLLSQFLSWSVQDHHYTLLEEEPHKWWDQNHFGALVEGASSKQEHIDNVIRACVPPSWTIEKMELTTLCLLRCGVFELLYTPETPSSVLFNEYVTLAHRLLLPNSHTFINGVLNTIFQRRGEFLEVPQNPVQHAQEMEDAFSLLGMEPNFSLDRQELEEKYVKAQQYAHPDFHKNPLHHTYAEDFSAKINAAYQQLKNPVTRAAVLLERKGWWPVENNPSIAQEIFLLQESCASREQLLQQITAREADFQNSWETERLAAQNAYLRLSYLYKMLKTLPDMK